MRIDSQTQIIKNKRSQRPKTFFQLIDRVGTNGQYQMKLVIIFSLIWFFVGMILINTNFLFYNQNFQCKQLGLLTSTCQETVCELSLQARKKYINKEKSQLKSMATELGQYYCQDEVYINVAKLCVYIGSLIGFVVFSYCIDNFGRKKSLCISLSICVIGNFMVSVSLDLFVASIGLFLSGLGANTSLNTTIFFFNQVVSNDKRQKYTVLVQLAFVFGSIIITSFYYLVGYWRIGSIILITIPSVVALFFVFFYVQQTPQFLVKGPNSEALKSINRIGKINYNIQNIVEEEDILAVKQTQTVLKEFDQLKLAPLYLIRFGSLRFITICTCFISFATYAMYYGSGFVINSMSFDIFASNFILQLSELLILVPTYFYIEKIKRKIAGAFVFLFAIATAGILMFIKIPAKCDQCFEQTLQIIFVILFRSAIAFYFCVFLLYLNELFPTRVSGLGVGIASAFGSLSTLLIQLFFKSLGRNTIILIFCGFSFTVYCLTRLINETKDKLITTEVEEIKELKQKQRLLLPGRGSIARFSLLKNSFRVEDNST